MSDLAVYDMDRTVTRRPTYTPFLLHCALRRARWRLAFLPVVALSMLAYVTRLIDRARLKEINHHLLLGHQVHPRELKPGHKVACHWAEQIQSGEIQPHEVKPILIEEDDGISPDVPLVGPASVTEALNP